MLLANVALPTVVPHILAAAILLPLVAAIEALFIRRALLPGYWPAFRLAMGANWRSTLVGLPLGYFFAFIGAIPAGMFVNFIPPGSRLFYFSTVFHTMFVGGMLPNPYIPLAMAIGLVVILVPYFFASVIIERRYLLRHLPDADSTRIRHVAWKMNLATYTCLMAFAIANLISVGSHAPEANHGKDKNQARILARALECFHQYLITGN